MRKYNLFQYFNNLGIDDLGPDILPELLAKPILVGLNDEILKSVSREVDISKTVWIAFVYKIMSKLLDTYPSIGINAVGIAAPQIGISRRFFVVDLPTSNIVCLSSKPYISEKIRLCVINPQILEVSTDIQLFKEMCLSLPGYGGMVPRPTWIRVGFYDMRLEYHTYILNDFAAGVFMHEYDHLDGNLYPYKANTLFSYDHDSKKILSETDINHLESVSKFEITLTNKVKKL